MTVNTQPAGKMQAASDWLAAFLADKPRLASECLQKGKAEGMTEQAIRKAKNALHVKETMAYTSFGRGASCVLVWQLPVNALAALAERQRVDAERHQRAVEQALGQISR